MNKMNIRGSEYPIKKIFSDDFVFTIPLYQRAYAWTTEESEELFQDLIRAMSGAEEAIDDLPPYFLGSIVLIKGDEPDAQVVDGQQRLTTLTMLLAALRSLIKSEYVEGLTSFLCEKGNVITGTPKRYRLRLRERDAQFFQKYIQDEGGIEALKNLQDASLSESQRNIRDNTLGFIRELHKLSEGQLIKLTQFIVNRCFLIVVAVSSPDLDSAYRIFSVLNSRGLDLSYPDILKAEIVNAVPLEQREDYATKWEEIESLLGTELFEELFFHLRAIFSKERLRKGVIEEFHEYVYPGRPQTSTPQDFIDNTLIRYAHALNYVVKANYQHGTSAKAKEINGIFRWLNQLDHGRWIPPALYFFFQNWSQPAQVLRFLTDLERLIVSFVICKTPPYKRIDRYCELLKAIHDGKDLYVPNSPLQLTSRECQEVFRMLNGDMYLMHHICRYVLLRLDAKLSEGTASYDYQTISIEHVLPQRPSPSSEWVKSFPSKEVREKYVHRLGNLVLLSRWKNIRAENVDFDLKKRQYFTADGGISPFVLTTQVLQHREWTPMIIEKRQNELMSTLKQLWRL
jgi:Protein of unknown function DUF262/Protein of unknown function (DUF1524)